MPDVMPDVYTHCPVNLPVALGGEDGGYPHFTEGGRGTARLTGMPKVLELVNVGGRWVLLTALPLSDCDQVTSGPSASVSLSPKQGDQTQ